MITDFKAAVDVDRCQRSVVRCWLLRNHSLRNAAVGVVVGVFGAHLSVFAADETVFEIERVGEAIEDGQVAVGVVVVISDFGFRISDLGKRVRAGWIGGSAASAVGSTERASGLHRAEVGYGQATV